MARTMKQEKITLVFREELFNQSQDECEASQVNMAELIRRACDVYLCMFPAPAVYGTPEQVPDGTGEINTEQPGQAIPLKKYPFFINSGLLAEMDRCAYQTGLSTDELANRALILYHACVQRRREAAEELGGSPDDPVSEGFSAEDQAGTDEASTDEAGSDEEYLEGEHDDAPADAEHATA